MEESIEITARTVEEAVETALAKLGRTREEVQISILSEGSRGLLGFGGEMARILVSPIAPPLTGEELAEKAKGVVQELLEKMGLESEVTLRPKEELTAEAGPSLEPPEPLPPALDIKISDPGVLIGRRGDTLRALQFITNVILARRWHSTAKVVVDVEGYRARREAALKNLALRLADQVTETRQPITLEAMPAHERRIIHLALVGNASVMTQSIGREDERRVVILPQKAVRSEGQKS